MNDTIKKGLLLNAVTGPKVTSPAVSPDTLREIRDPYYGFLQIYQLKTKNGEWHGHLKNIGMQYPIPYSVLLPPWLTMKLGLNNNDRVTLHPSKLNEAHTVYYRQLSEQEEQAMQYPLPTLYLGRPLGPEFRFLFNGMSIELVQWEPEGSFIGPNSNMIQGDPTEPSFSLEEEAMDVQTGFGEDQTPLADYELVPNEDTKQTNIKENDND